VSAILRHGPSYFTTVRQELLRWMESLEFDRLDQIRGRLSLVKAEAPSALERAQYIRTITGWSSWLGYQAYVDRHGPGKDSPQQ